MNGSSNHDIMQNNRNLVPLIQSPSSALIPSEKRIALRKRNVQKKTRDKKRLKKKHRIKPPSQNSNLIPIISFSILAIIALVLSQYPHLSLLSPSSVDHPFLPTFQKALQMIETTDISWVSDLSQSLLQTSNLLKDVSHFTQKFASNGEVGSMQSLEADFFSLSRICKETYKLGFNIFAEARTFTKTCSRRLDLVLSVARDDRLNNAQELLTRMSETLQSLVQDHDRILDNLSNLQQQSVKTTRKMNLDVRWNENWALSRKVAVFSLMCLSSQTTLEEIKLPNGYEREARESLRIFNELEPVCKLLSQATETLQKTRTNLHLFHLQLKASKDTLNTKASLTRENISDLELQVDNAKAYLERLSTKYEDLVSARSTNR